MLPLCFSITDNPLNTHTASHKRAITPESVRPFKAPRALPQPAETVMVLKDESYDLLTTKQRESKQTSSGFCFLVCLGCAYFSGSSFSAWFQLHVELLTHMSHILKNISFLCFSDATCAVRGVYIYIYTTHTVDKRQLALRLPATSALMSNIGYYRGRGHTQQSQHASFIR